MLELKSRLNLLRYGYNAIVFLVLSLLGLSRRVEIKLVKIDSLNDYKVVPVYSIIYFQLGFLVLAVRNGKHVSASLTSHSGQPLLVLLLFELVTMVAMPLVALLKNLLDIVSEAVDKLLTRSRSDLLWLLLAPLRVFIIVLFVILNFWWSFNNQAVNFNQLGEITEQIIVRTQEVKEASRDIHGLFSVSQSLCQLLQEALTIYGYILGCLFYHFVVDVG